MGSYAEQNGIVAESKGGKNGSRSRTSVWQRYEHQVLVSQAVALAPKDSLHGRIDP